MMFNTPATLHKPCSFGMSGFGAKEDPMCFYRVKYNGTHYKLPILEAFGDQYTKTHGRINGMRAHVFKAKCWWADGGTWWIGAIDKHDRDRWGDLLGPFNDHEQAMMYLKLTQDEVV